MYTETDPQTVTMPLERPPASEGAWEGVAIHHSTFSRNFIMIWLMETMFLSPVKIFSFPFNMELMDFWILGGIPFIWMLFLAKKRTVISWAYVPALLVILVGSFASTFFSINPTSALTVIAKEMYVFLWFLTVTILLGTLTGADMHRVVIVWNRVAVLHGLFIIGQFFVPALWQFTVSFAGKEGEFEHYRSPGLFLNANGAAFFQLMGFVPLILARESRFRTLILGIVLLLSLMATGSMGAMLGLAVGTTVALALVLIMGKKWDLILKFIAPAFVGALMLGGLALVVIEHSPSYKDHLQSILIGRADRSSGGRFSLWQRGIDAFLQHSGIFRGVGPENFREVDYQDKQLHNDFIAFSVERGLVAGLAFMLFLTIAISRAIYLFFYSHRHGHSIEVAVFIGAFVAVMLESLFHQIFHHREMWMVLAFLEAYIYRRTFRPVFRERSP